MAITTTQLDGFFKQVYGDDVPDLVPKEMHIQNNIKFLAGEKQLGNKFNQPVKLTESNGFSFAGADAGVFALAAPRSLTVKNAQVSGQQIVLREQMDYETAARSASSKNAFAESTKYIIEAMQKSHRKMLELELLYGQDELGVVASISTNTITIQTAEWAPGIWAGLEGALVEVLSSTLAAARSTGGNGCVIQSVDIESRTITIDANHSGIVNGDRIYLHGQCVAGGTFRSMMGIHKVLTTADKFGINGANYSLWNAPTQSAGSASLTLSKVGSGVAKSVAKGLADEVLLMVNVNTFVDLVDDQAALVRHVDRSAKKSGSKGVGFVNGADSLDFYSVNGHLKILPSTYVKEGYAYGLCLDEWKRVGSVDYSMKVPAMGGQIFFHLEGFAGVELRSYSNQAIFCHAPGKNFLISGIVNS